MDDNVVFLTFTNDNAPEGEYGLSTCVECRNKTFTVRHDATAFPMMYCAACNQAMGRIGWWQDET